MTPTPEPLTLVFSPNFGAFHRHPDQTTRFHRDNHGTGLAGKIIPIKGRTTIEIGRHQECLLRVNRDGIRDEKGYDVFNAIARKHVTMVWADSSIPGYSWLRESQWLIMAGGVFIDAETGTRESSGGKAKCYLQGQKLPSNNPEPLFRPGEDITKLCLSSHGRILIIRGLLGENTTAYPPEVWEGDGWPDTTVSANNDPKDGTDPGQERRAAEDQVIQSHESENEASPATGWGFANEALDRVSEMPLGRLVIIVLGFLAGFAIFLILGFARPEPESRPVLPYGHPSDLRP